MAQTQHLIRRGDVWYYRRRVPLSHVEHVGKKFIQFSLHTTDLKVAKKQRAAEDLKWFVRFQETASPEAVNVGGPEVAPPNPKPLSESEVVEQVRAYVERTSERARRRLQADPPSTETDRSEIADEASQTLSLLKDRDDPLADEWVYAAGKDLLRNANGQLDVQALTDAIFAEWVRRGLIELEKRRLSQVSDNNTRLFFDQAFNPERGPDVTFEELTEQFMQLVGEEALANGTSQKWVEKQRANVELLREVIGKDRSVRDIDYDVCLHIRGMLARLPSNRNKYYAGIPIEEAVSRGEAEQKPTLSPVTQAQYLQTLKGVLDLALRKRLISVNPASDLKPLKRDRVAPAEKRRSFTPKQLKDFFESDFYRKCALHELPYANDKHSWRFWMPLLCLFMGMRPNEACQLSAEDVKRTDEGTWFIDVVSTSDDDELASGGHKKILKTETSCRRIPIHPEIIACGFLKFVEERAKSGMGARLFAKLKADVYGNYAKYPLKRFRESFLPKAIALEPRQSFYSFRHNFRDALRQIGAPPDALQALGGWSQGKLTSDNYGQKANPDYQMKYMKQIAFAGLTLKHLYIMNAI